MKLTDWLFGYYKESPVLQGLLAGILIAHLAVLGGWALAWLWHALPWPTR